MTAVPSGGHARDDRRAIAVVARQVVGLLHEVEAGLRPSRSIAPLLCPRLRRRCASLLHDGHGGAPIARVRRMLVSPGAAGVDVVVVRSRGGRVTALSLRMQRSTGGRWQIVDLVMPERPGTATGVDIPASSGGRHVASATVTSVARRRHVSDPTTDAAPVAASAR